MRSQGSHLILFALIFLMASSCQGAKSSKRQWNDKKVTKNLKIYVKLLGLLSLVGPWAVERLYFPNVDPDLGDGHHGIERHLVLAALDGVAPSIVHCLELLDELVDALVAGASPSFLVDGWLVLGFKWKLDQAWLPFVPMVGFHKLAVVKLLLQFP